jgi:hypothetical protein
MTREQLRIRRGRELAERPIPLSAGEAHLLSNANWQADAVARLATDIAARLHRAPDGA